MPRSSVGTRSIDRANGTINDSCWEDAEGVVPNCIGTVVLLLTLLGDAPHGGALGAAHRARHGLAVRPSLDARWLQRLGVAGVIGRRKFVYDLWGDTVNTASRMESHGAPDRIHVSEAARDLLTESFVIEERGIVDVKGKGQMKTFWLVESK
jgi:hypothetical protein